MYLQKPLISKRAIMSRQRRKENGPQNIVFLKKNPKIYLQKLYISRSGKNAQTMRGDFLEPIKPFKRFHEPTREAKMKKYFSTAETAAIQKSAPANLAVLG